MVFYYLLFSFNKLRFFHYKLNTARFITLKCWQLYRYNGRITHNFYSIFQTLKDYFISLYTYMHIPNDSYLQLKRSVASTFLAGNNWVVWSVSDKFSPQYDQHTERHLNIRPMGLIAHWAGELAAYNLLTRFNINSICLFKFSWGIFSTNWIFLDRKLT